MRGTATENGAADMPEYELKVSARAKRLSITIRPGGSVTVTVPRRHDMARVEAFVRQHAEWIRRKAKRAAQRPQLLLAHLGARDYAKHKEAARAAVRQLIEECNVPYGYAVRTVRIGNQKGRWGSCSARGNLNFNYKILFLPRELQEYVVVHELCHLKEMNHSDRFWALVEKTVPNWHILRKELRKY